MRAPISFAIPALAALALAGCTSAPPAPATPVAAAVPAATAGTDSALRRYASSIATKIRANIVIPPDARGNPEAVFEVTQSPKGEVLAVKLLRSSGIASLDKSIAAAIKRASPLPKPERQELFVDKLNLTFRPMGGQ